jgi:hypothetical protein
MQVNHLPDSIPIHIKDALTRGSIPDAILYDYDSERDAHHALHPSGSEILQGHGPGTTTRKSNTTTPRAE